MSVIKLAGLVAFLVCSAPISAAAANPTKASCAAAHAEAQELRLDNKLVKARESLLTCADSLCPRIIKKDCSRWLNEVEADLPTIVISVRDAAGRSRTDVNIFLDGVELERESLERPVSIDPGSHDLLIEGSDERLERNLLVREGEKNRNVAIEVGIRRDQPRSESAAAEQPSPELDASPQPARRGPDILSWTLVGVGAAALSGATYLGLSGKAQEREYRNTCAPDCNQDDVDALKTRYYIADGLIAVGVISLGVAAYRLFAPSEPQQTSSRSFDLRVNGAPGAAAVSVTRVW